MLLIPIKAYTAPNTWDISITQHAKKTQESVYEHIFHFRTAKTPITGAKPAFTSKIIQLDGVLSI